MRNVDVVGTGFAVLDRIYATGAGPAAWEALGGSCGNVLVSLAMLRRRVVPILTLGADDIGQQLVDEFATAGAETSYIRRRHGRASPVLAQLVDPTVGRHSFAWTCPETRTALPRYEPVEAEEVESARSVLRRCAVFYVDRVTDAVADAMEVAAAAGAIVYFEPSKAERSPAFTRALAAAAILKCSAERISELPATTRALTIVTHAETGLEVVKGGERRWLDPHPASDVRDTCGAGDMVSVGIIHWLLSLRPGTGADLDVPALVPGIRAGQRLAAANCAYVGARGLFRQRGSEAARAILQG